MGREGKKEKMRGKDGREQCGWTASALREEE